MNVDANHSGTRKMRDELNKEELLNFIENHHVLYIRHSMDTTAEIYRKLIDEGIVAVHYTERLKEVVDSTNLKNHEDPENFEGYARNVLRRLSRHCKNGVIVFADYSDPPLKSIQKTGSIGIIPEGQKYKVKRYYGHPNYPNGLIYKQVELCNYTKLSYADYAAFLAIHPRGGTLSQWKAEEPVKFTYKRKLDLPIDSRSISLDVLFPAQQEVLCSEYLRTKAPDEIRLKHLLLPVGRGMKTVDIDGVNERIHLFAQVSYSDSKSDIKRKVQDLTGLAKGYGGSKDLVRVYFGPTSIKGLVHSIDPDIQFVPLEEVFEVMKGTGIINDMLGIRPTA